MVNDTRFLNRLTTNCIWCVMMIKIIIVTETYIEKLS